MAHIEIWWKCPGCHVYHDTQREAQQCAISHVRSEKVMALQMVRLSMMCGIAPSAITALTMAQMILQICDECGAKMDGAAGSFTGLAAVAATDNHVGCKWYPVTERMPDHPIRLDWSDNVLFDDDLKEEYKSYPMLVYDGEFHIAEHYMTESVWIEKDGDGCLKNVTHWMQMPEPPKEADNG